MCFRDSLTKNLICCLRVISKSNSVLERNKGQNIKLVSCHGVNSELVPMRNAVCGPDLHILLKL